MLSQIICSDTQNVDGFIWSLHTKTGVVCYSEVFTTLFYASIFLLPECCILCQLLRDTFHKDVMIAHNWNLTKTPFAVIFFQRFNEVAYLHSSAVMACGKLWSDRIIIVQGKFHRIWRGNVPVSARFGWGVHECCFAQWVSDTFFCTQILCCDYVRLEIFCTLVLPYHCWGGVELLTMASGAINHSLWEMFTFCGSGANWCIHPVITYGTWLYWNHSNRYCQMVLSPNLFW